LRTHRRILVLASFLLLASLAPALAQSNWAVVNTLHIGRDGGWDYVIVDPQTHRLFVTRTEPAKSISTPKTKT
jgi:hypothetical protein